MKNTKVLIPIALLWYFNHVKNDYRNITKHVTQKLKITDHLKYNDGSIVTRYIDEN